MDARREKRIIVNIQAELIHGDKRLSSFIENLSEKGIYVTAPAPSSREFTPDEPVELRFEFPEGVKLHLHCRIKWVYRTPPHGLTLSIGMEVTDPPLTYRETVKSFPLRSL